MSVICCIFAHPDDETAVAGTIALMAEDNDVYLICATSGDNGENDIKDSGELLPLMREDEVRASAKALGVKHVYFLGLIDGEISNNNYHETSRRIMNIIEDIQPDTLMTFEPRGITGHLDHIAISFITTHVFYQQHYAKKLMYACMSEPQRAQVSRLPEYFVYFPPGYKSHEVDEIIDVSSVWSTRLKALKAHKSQKKDMESFILPVYENAPKEEYFLVKTK